MTTSSTSPYRTLSPEETEDIASRILYEDNHVLVLNKRPGEIVQGDKTGDEPLVEKLKAFIALRDRKPGQVFMGVPPWVCPTASTVRSAEPSSWPRPPRP